jgi:hypothetical protein
MKSLFLWAVLGPLFFALAWMSYRGLSQKPVPIFLLEESADEMDAFRVDLFLSGSLGRMEPIALSVSQARQLREAFDQKDLSQIKPISQSLNAGSLIVGVSSPLENWPWFLGGGWAGWTGSENNTAFDNLTLADKIYLSLAATAPNGLPLAGVPAPTQNQTGVPSNLTPVPVVTPLTPGAVVRVKILNGCGIKNAADWAASRLKGPGIVISAVANADQFHYPKTLVQSSIGVPVALEEALERLGLSADQVEEMTSAQGDADVVVTVGRDYLNLRGKKRDRTHNGKK